MRIAYVSAGAAGMFCGSCMHDNTLAAALRRMGHEIALIPTYTPMRTDEPDVSLDRIFYGAVNLYLQQKSAFFRRTPRLVDRLLDSPLLLGWVSRRASSVSPADLGDLTLSVLRGEEGHQRKELDRLVSWLRDDFRPDLVHLTNSMFLGFAAAMRRELKVPILCSVQGEDLFLEGLPDPIHGQVVSMLRLKAKDADGFIATTSAYAAAMAALLGIPPDRMTVVRLGVSLEGHDGPPDRRDDPVFTIGYLARLSPEKGLDLLAEAFRMVSDRAGRGRVRLRAAGYLGPGERRWFGRVRSRIDGWGLGGTFEYLGEVDRAGKTRFLRSLDVLSVPAIFREPKGLYVLEALASGVPVVEPAHGAFPEMIELTGGGLLFEPGSSTALADQLTRLMEDAPLRAALGASGRRAVRESFSAERMAEETLKVYLAFLPRASRHGAAV